MHHAPMTQPAPYLAEVHAALPRVLALFETNPISAMRGVGDRYRWAWKGTDFANGTFQSAVHGLALLVAHQLLPGGMREAHIIVRIEAALDGIRTITRRNGSLDEILPLESSYCVTALAAFDALCALDALADRFSDAQRAHHLATITPLIGFLVRTRESHGIISNHLAVAVAALTRWQSMTGQDVSAARDDVLNTILAHYCEEGWFREYDGADAGYQTLALDYLTDIDAGAPALGLRERLAKTCEFLSYCAHPDGSFGGLYGSRNTRFLYPAGIETLAVHSPHAAALAEFARKAHAQRTVVGLAAMDDANLMPMFTSFCRAAVLAVHTHTTAADMPHSAPPFQRPFPRAGLVVTRTTHSYSIVNWRKGAVSHFGEGAIIDGGALARDAKGTYYSSQVTGDATKLIAADANHVVIEAPMKRYHVSHPTPIQMVILRLLCVSVMRIPALNALIKKLLVWLLISRKSASNAIVRRTITLQPNFAMNDTWLSNPDKLELQKPPIAFQAVHMASAGYWQCGDDA